MVHVGQACEEDMAIAEVTGNAYAAVLTVLRPGNRARDVCAAWRGVVDAAGLSHYRR